MLFLEVAHLLMMFPLLLHFFLLLFLFLELSLSLINGYVELSLEGLLLCQRYFLLVML